MSDASDSMPTAPAAGVSTANERNEQRMPVLVRQPNGGALYSGGVPGNKGGTGALPSAIRRMLRGSFAERVAILEAIADGTQPIVPNVVVNQRTGEVTIVMTTPAPRDRIQALELLARYGLGTKTEITGEDGGPIETKQVLKLGNQEIEF